MSHPSSAVPVSLHLDPGSRAPIYEQIVAHFRFQIIGGQIKGGARLPSVRHVSTTLTVNPLTVSKAYSTLKREGLVVTDRGNGTFVSKDVGERYAHVDRLVLLQPLMTQLSEQANVLGVSCADVLEGMRRALCDDDSRNREHHNGA